MDLAERVRTIRERMDRAAARAARDPATVTLVAVSKKRSRDEIMQAHAAGIVDFGENRIQEAVDKFREPLPIGSRLHMIGHLQTNKARPAAELFDCVHSLDSPTLAAKLGQLARRSGRSLEVMLQVDLAGESRKHGVTPDELDLLVDQVRAEAGLMLTGLMVLPPWNPDPEKTRPYFAQLRVLAAERGLQHLSMGMSHDFEVAIEEGATLVRIGEAIFGPRPVEST